MFEAQQKLERAKVDEVVAQIEARREQRQKQLEMSSRRNQAKYDELNKLYEKKAKLIGDPDADSAELQNVENQISRLEQEFFNPSLEDAGNSLKSLEPNKNEGQSSSLFE